MSHVERLKNQIKGAQGKIILQASDFGRGQWSGYIDAKKQDLPEFDKLEKEKKKLQRMLQKVCKKGIEFEEEMQGKIEEQKARLGRVEELLKNLLVSFDGEISNEECHIKIHKSKIQEAKDYLKANKISAERFLCIKQYENNFISDSGGRITAFTIAKNKIKEALEKAIK